MKFLDAGNQAVPLKGSNSPRSINH